MQNSVVLVDSREAALKESGDVILSKVGHTSFGFGFQACNYRQQEKTFGNR